MGVQNCNLFLPLLLLLLQWRQEGLVSTLDSSFIISVWAWVLSSCCFLIQETSLHIVCPHSGVYSWVLATNRETWKNDWGNPAMDWQPSCTLICFMLQEPELCACWVWCAGAHVQLYIHLTVRTIGAIGTKEVPTPLNRRHFHIYAFSIPLLIQRSSNQCPSKMLNKEKNLQLLWHSMLCVFLTYGSS